MNSAEEKKILEKNEEIFDILDKTVQNVVKLILLRGIKVSFAESCTGGLLSTLLTEVSGVSECYDFGICSYSNEIKNRILGVPQTLLDEYGAVSEQVALSMAEGLRKISGAEICISVTGIAGPGGGTDKKPVGTVFVGQYFCNKLSATKLNELYDLKDKSRKNIRYHTALAVYSQIEKLLEDERLLHESGIIT